MLESYIEVENASPRSMMHIPLEESLKMKPFSREVHVPYKRLLSRVASLDPRSTRAITNKALDKAQEQGLIVGLFSISVSRLMTHEFFSNPKWHYIH